jgi:hypothetical protein
MAAEPTTPLMRQYNSVKQQVPNALLMFRLGDFYELFYEDAVVAARELEITLTSRNKEKGAAIPMCGVPYHSAESYIARLIQKGHRVAICDQMEDARLAKKLVKREITRIVTPGTATDAHLLRSHENNYLASVALNGERAGVAHVDVSTGEFRVTELEPSEVGTAIEQLGAREVLRRRIGTVACCAPSAKAGRSATITPTALCASTSNCCHSMAAAWRGAMRRSARPGLFSTIYRRRSARLSTIWTGHPITTVPRAWCWMR